MESPLVSCPWTLPHRAKADHATGLSILKPFGATTPETNPVAFSRLANTNIYETLVD